MPIIGEPSRNVKLSPPFYVPLTRIQHLSCESVSVPASVEFDCASGCLSLCDSVHSFCSFECASANLVSDVDCEWPVSCASVHSSCSFLSVSAVDRCESVKCESVDRFECVSDRHVDRISYVGNNSPCKRECASVPSVECASVNCGLPSHLLPTVPIESHCGPFAYAVGVAKDSPCLWQSEGPSPLHTHTYAYTCSSAIPPGCQSFGDCPRQPPSPSYSVHTVFEGRKRGTKKKNLRLVTVNSNSYTTFKDSLLPVLAADDHIPDIIFVQELKVSSQFSLSASSHLRSRGWRFVCAPCKFGLNKSRKAGVGLLFRSFLDAGPGVASVPTIVFPHHVCCSPIRLKGHGIVMMYSVYFESGPKVGGINFEIAKCIVAHLCRHRTPFILGGDWNNDVCAVVGLFSSLGVSVVPCAPSVATCYSARSESTIDFFLVHHSLGASMCNVCVDMSTSLSPHVPVCMSFVLAGPSIVVQVFRKPPKLPVEPPAGPSPCPPDWTEVWCDVSSLVEPLTAAGYCAVPSPQLESVLDNVFERWHLLASAELCSVLGVDSGEANKIGKPLRTVEEDLSSVLSRGHSFEPMVSRVLTTTATRLFQVVALLRKCVDNGHSRIPVKFFALLKRARIIVSRHIPLIKEPCFDLASLFRWLDWLVRVDLEPFALQFMCDSLSFSAKALMSASAVCASIERNKTKESWEEFALKALTSNISSGFKFTRPLIESHDFVEVEGGRCYDKSAVLEANACKFSKSWCCNADIAAPDFRGIQSVRLSARLTPHLIRRSSSNFAKQTAVVDGWHPRHYALLCDSALSVLALVFEFIEFVGLLPSHMRQLKVELIEQDVGLPASKRRPIGLFIAFYRVWAKCRVVEVREWERVNCSDSFFNNSTGRPVADTVWRASSRSALSRASSQVSVEFQGDLRQAYEKVNHSILWDSAGVAGYPLAILRVSIGAYRSPRIPTMCNIASAPCIPLKGIVAGSSFATCELKLFLRDGLRSIVYHHPQVDFNVHVDDIVLANTSSSSAKAVEELHGALSICIRVILHDLELEFAPDKCFLVGSSASVVKLASKVVGVFGGRPVAQVVRLGLHSRGTLRVPRGPKRSSSLSMRPAAVGIVCL